MPTSTNTKVRNLRANRDRIKSQATRVRKPSRSHVLPANVTSEGQWTSGPAPQVKTSRMFIGMLALHLVAVGGLVAFHFYGHDPAPSNTAATPPVHEPKAALAAVAAKSRSVPVARVAPTPTAAPAAPGMMDYIVRMDETWESIALARGLTTDELHAANPNLELNVGRMMKIPPAARLITSSNGHSETRPNTIQPPAPSTPSSAPRYVPNPDLVDHSHVTTSPLAKTSPTTMGGPIKANATAATSPKPSLAGKTYTVSKGDTLFGIAKRRGLTEKALMKYNGLSDAAKLRVGQKIKLPPSD